MTKVLAICAASGRPLQWVTKEDAITHQALKKVQYQIGREDQFVFRGGINRASGIQSQIATAPIIAVVDANPKRTVYTPPVSNSVLFKRDGKTCIYCGRTFGYRDLTREHLHPRSKGGGDDWMNLATSCGYHNNLKGDIPHNEFCERYNIQPHYLPYIPSFSEYLFLQECDYALPVQIEYLMLFFPKVSRIHQIAKGYL